ncbi:MAG: ATP-dependent Clp protease ATP-binding subunit [Lewinellaceae bacterium]|nr:ATP-dependent Clp protease ATP-binding subunit [Lewinella sp.]MCB9278864.1 ATP-dependent Clp protease ATP-binding subunit [Lewinellaceae bacterium]
MAQIKLKIPVLVQDVRVENRPQYYIRPVFLAYPVASHPRYEQAVAQFQREIRQIFKGFSLNRKNLEQLLWLQFHPEDLHYSQVQCEGKVGKEFYSGPFGVISFSRNNLGFACMPSLANFMFMTDPDKGAIEKQAQSVVQILLKKFRNEEDEDDQLEISASYAGKREFITAIEVSVRITHSPFSFEADFDHQFFRRMFDDTEFEGEVEVEKTGFDLNSRFPSELDRAYHREDLVQQVYKTVFTGAASPIVLVGPPGVGKNAIVEEAVYRYCHKNTRKEKVQRIWKLDPNRVIAGMSVVGMWEKRFESIINYLRHPYEKSKIRDKMLVDNPIALLRVGKSASNSLTLSDVLKPYLEKRQLQLILLASPEEWSIIQEKDRRFSELFQIIRVDEPDAYTANLIILEKRKYLEAERQCSISIQAVKLLIDLHRNYLRARALPGGVLDLLEKLTAKFRYSMVDAPDVREEFRSLSGLNETIFDINQPFEEDEIRAGLTTQLVGQPEAVFALEGAVNLIKAKLNDPDRPISSFLFVGPTGVGKTQAAKVLCRQLMGSENHLLRLDMNEYLDDGAVDRLMGSEWMPEGQLVSRVRYQPFGILLLDEIEKAHPAVYDILLQVLDEGRLTDHLGRTTDFTNTVIIMTSNLGSEEVKNRIGFGQAQAAEDAVYIKAIERHFRPEFVNRINQIVIFKPLELPHILDIARIQIKELLQRDGFVRRSTMLNISQGALEWVARRGFDARMGGRALKRQIEQDLTTLSAEQLVRTNAETPILFDILLENDRLVPRITPLEFTDPIEDNWFPKLPDEKNGRRFYGDLLRSLEQLEKQIERLERRPTDVVETSNWQYYGFKARISQLKEDIQNGILAHNDRQYRGMRTVALRLKQGGLPTRRDWAKDGKENLRDRLFQDDAIREISEAYRYNKPDFDPVNSGYLNLYLDTAFLMASAEGFLRGEPEKAELLFESCVEGQGAFEIEYLADLYCGLFRLLDLPFQTPKNKKVIAVEGYNLSALLPGEQGMALFYLSHRNPLPVRVQIRINGKPVAGPLKVLRIFDGNKTVTDLRTGFSNAVNLTPEEFKLMVYGGFAGAAATGRKQKPG